MEIGFLLWDPVHWNNAQSQPTPRWRVSKEEKKKQHRHTSLCTWFPLPRDFSAKHGQSEVNSLDKGSANTFHQNRILRCSQGKIEPRRCARSFFYLCKSLLSTLWRKMDWRSVNKGGKLCDLTYRCQHCGNGSNINKRIKTNYFCND